MYNKTYISSAATTIVSSVSCVLHSVVIGETAAGTITLQDGGVTFAVLKTSIGEGEYTFDVVCKNSLTVVTGAASKLTVSWKPTA